MIKGIYTGATGMNLQQAAMDNVSHNLANATTAGFKKDRLRVEPFPDLVQLSQKLHDEQDTRHRPIGSTNQGAAITQAVTDFSQGVLRETGYDTDYALTESGFFTLTKPGAAGNEHYYTRDGSFRLDQEGYLVNDSGYLVQGNGGAIQIEEGQEFFIDELGRVMVEGEVADTLAIVDFANRNWMERYGDNLFLAGDQEGFNVENPGVVQGFLENSNVDALEETVQMITASRAYETGQKIIQAHDAMLDLAINKVGRVR